MIETISPEQGRMRDAATAAAAANYRPTFQSVAPVKPDPALVRGIGFSTNADAFRGSSPDLQSLLDALLTNFGHEHDVVEDEARDLRTRSGIKENNAGSREAVASLQDTNRRGEETVALDRELEAKRSKPRKNAAEGDSLKTRAENRLNLAETEIGRAETLSSRAGDAVTSVEPTSEESADGQKLQRSAEVFDQKAAAAESAARLHRVMALKILRNAQAQLEETKNKEKSMVPSPFENDPEFAARLGEMNRILREKLS